MSRDKLRGTGRTTRLILSIINFIENTNAEQPINLLVVSHRIGNEIFRKVKRVCDILGLPMPKVNISSDLKYVGDTTNTFIDHTWYEYSVHARG